LRHILKVDRDWDIVVVGAGDIGSGIARYRGFANRGFCVAMVFDNAPEKIGTKIGDFVVKDINDLEEAIRKANIRIAMLAIPAASAQEVTDKLVKAGIKSILNYAPLSINVPAEVRVQYIDPSVHLQRMTYYL